MKQKWYHKRHGSEPDDFEYGGYKMTDIVLSYYLRITGSFLTGFAFGFSIIFWSMK